MSAGIPDEILNGPALLPPQNITPNFDNPGANNVPGYAVISTCLILASIAISIRLYTQIFRLRKLYIEDCELNPVPTQTSSFSAHTIKFWASLDMYVYVPLI